MITGTCGAGPTPAMQPRARFGTTHFIKGGAIEMATLMVGEVRKNNGPLASSLK